jgi:hypothetical protein
MAPGLAKGRGGSKGDGLRGSASNSGGEVTWIRWRRGQRCAATPRVYTFFFSDKGRSEREGVNRNETGRWIERENHNLWSTTVSYKSDRISFVRYESTNKKAKEKPKLNPNRPALKSDGPELQIAEEPAFLPLLRGGYKIKEKVKCWKKICGRKSSFTLLSWCVLIYAD